MRIQTPSKAPSLQLVDIENTPIPVGGTGRKMLLSFFREANCPFCNFRVYELTHNHRALEALGLDIVAVFSSDEAQIRRFVARQPRPFRMVADPDDAAHRLYGVERSFLGKLIAMMRRLPAMMRGMREVGMAGMATGNLLPADFLIDEHGRVVETYYGRDAGDHIPIERIELFVARGLASRPATLGGPSTTGSAQA